MQAARVQASHAQIQKCPDVERFCSKWGMANSVSMAHAAAGFSVKDDHT